MVDSLPKFISNFVRHISMSHGKDDYSAAGR